MKVAGLTATAESWNWEERLSQEAGHLRLELAASEKRLLDNQATTLQHEINQNRYQ